MLWIFWPMVWLCGGASLVAIAVSLVALLMFWAIVTAVNLLSPVWTWIKSQRK